MSFRGPGPSPSLRSAAADHVESVLPIYERRYPGDDRPRKAVDAARAYERGDIDAAALTRAATGAARATANAAADFANAVGGISYRVDGDARMVLAAWAAARAATWSALPDATTARVLGYVLHRSFANRIDSALSWCVANFTSAAADVGDADAPYDAARQDKIDALGRSCIEGRAEHPG
jgi:hypothetical protein